MKIFTVNTISISQIRLNKMCGIRDVDGAVADTQCWELILFWTHILPLCPFSHVYLFCFILTLVLNVICSDSFSLVWISSRVHLFLQVLLRDRWESWIVFTLDPITGWLYFLNYLFKGWKTHVAIAGSAEEGMICVFSWRTRKPWVSATRPTIFLWFTSKASS